MWSLPDRPKQRVRVELLNTFTAGIDTNTLTTFTLLLIVRTQRCMWSLDKVGCTAKLSQQSFCHWWQNIHYHLTNLQNHTTTNMFDVVRIITSKQQIFSVRSTNFQKNWSPIQSCPTKIGFSPDRAHCSSLPATSAQSCRCCFFSLDLGFFCFIWGFYWKSGVFSTLVKFLKHDMLFYCMFHSRM